MFIVGTLQVFGPAVTQIPAASRNIHETFLAFFFFFKYTLNKNSPRKSACKDQLEI